MLSRTGTAARNDLENRLQLVEGGGDELIHTPSVAADLATGMSQGDAARAQRLREQVRIIDADLAETKAQLIRYRLLRGPSGKRFECDATCLVGGCGEEYAEEDGVLCASGCQLFLCHQCFGQLVVQNECQLGGRYDAPVENDTDGGLMSAPGSLPCPNYPSECSCAHIPIAEIQRALLHSSNRGEDGASEDLESPGHSPHKIFLMARRRQAENQLSTDGGDGASPRLRESTLVRTVTEARQITSALEGVVGLTRAASVRSGARAALADKVDELQQLREELAQLPDTAIPAGQRRLCAQCCGEFTSFEGAQCSPLHRDHFLCNVCFGGYLMKACSRGGVFEQALKNVDGMVVSPSGKLPCAFFGGNSEQQVAFNPVSAQAASAAAAEARVDSVENPLATGLPKSECHCAVIEHATIEKVLMDPRNTSISFWRERKASESIEVQAASSGVNADQQADSGPWFLGMELLSRGWTPSSVHETARLRIGQEEQQRAELLSPTKNQGEVESLADLYQAVANALTRGASIQCPACGVEATKNDACVHMDSCPCRTGWCFLCGKLSGSDPGKCPRGAGGCDEASCFLESHPGWNNFAINGESPGAGARDEFLRRRQAFYVRRVKENADPQLWAQLREKSPTLLTDVPTPGRKIDWESVSTAEYPLFGANVGRDDISDIVDREAPVDNEAAERFEQHFREELEADARRERRQRRQRQIKMAWIFMLTATATLLTAWVTLTDFDNPQKFSEPPIAPLPQLLNGNETTDSSGEQQGEQCTRDVANVMSVPCQCGISCDLMFWVPLIELVLGVVLMILVVCFDRQGAQSDMGLICCLIPFGLATFGWPLFTGPLANWFVVYMLAPCCVGAGANFFVSMALAALIDPDIDDDTVESAIMGTSGVAFWVYIGLTFHARSVYDQPPVDADLADPAVVAPVESLVHYECTTICVAMHWVIRGIAAVSCACLPYVFYADWEENWQPNGICSMAKIPIAAITIVTMAWWPEVVDADTWMYTAWMYPALFVCLCIVWLLACRMMETVLRRFRLEDAFEDYNLHYAFTIGPPLLACTLLYIFRSSVPEYEGETSSFLHVVHAEFMCWVFLAIIAEVVIFDAEAGPAPLTIFLAICWSMQDAQQLQQLWILILMMVLFSIWLGLIGLALLETFDEDDVPAWMRRCARSGPLLLCCVLIFQNVLLAGTYYASRIDDMPFAFVVEGASIAELNGVYHLRTDLRDGVAAEPECPDPWYECWWDAINDDEEEQAAADKVQLIASDCLTDVAGHYIYQAHSDEAPGTGALLYKPIDADNHAWIVAPSSTAYDSCFKSTAGYLHSIESVCALRPDAARRNLGFLGFDDESTDCGQQWKEAVVPSRSDSGAMGSAGKVQAAAHAEPVWQDAPQVTVTAHPECAEDDMCCLVNCFQKSSQLPEAGAMHGDCTTELHSGAQMGICSCKRDDAATALLDRWMSQSTNGFACKVGGSTKISSFNNATAAQSACDADPSCMYIQDDGCDGCGTWKTCSAGRSADVTRTATSGTCLYQK